jgi:hypothetical protein
MDTQTRTGDAVLVKRSEMPEQVGAKNSRASWRDEGLSGKYTLPVQSDRLLHHYFNGLLVLFFRSGLAWSGVLF